MIASPTFARACVGLSALSLLAAATAWWLPASPTVRPVPSGVPDSVVATVVAPTARTDEAIGTVIAQNIFSATRSAPASRWSAPGLDLSPTPEPPVMDTLAAALPSGDSTLTDVVPALYGTMVGESPRRALLRLDPTDPAPRLFAVGDRQGGWRVVAIDARRVVLAGRSGTRTLRLPEPGADR
jgi:hypothetical protein